MTTSVLWETIKAEYIAGTESIKEIAARRKVSEPALEKRAQRGGWAKLRQASTEKVEQAVIADTEALRAEELASMNRADISLAKNLRALINRQIQIAAEAGGDMKPGSIRTLAAAASEVQRVWRLALDVSTDNSQVTGAGGSPLIPEGAGVLVVPAPVSADEWEAQMNEYVPPQPPPATLQ